MLTQFKNLIDQLATTSGQDAPAVFALATNLDEYVKGCCDDPEMSWTAGLERDHNHLLVAYVALHEYSDSAKNIAEQLGQTNTQPLH
jgi:hypothetical protein